MPGAAAGAGDSREHSEVINEVAFSADGQVLASGSSDTRIKLWDVASARELRTLARNIGGIQKPIVFAPKDDSFAVGQLKTEDWLSRSA